MFYFFFIELETICFMVKWHQKNADASTSGIINCCCYRPAKRCDLIWKNFR